MYATRRGRFPIRQSIAIPFIASLAIGACASPGQTQSSVPDLEACIAEALTLGEGTWDYTSVTARISGTQTVYHTTSVHGRIDDDTWSYQSSGGDAEEDEPASFLRLRGN